MPAPREILDLVARFEQQLDAYKSGQYNETQLRREFLDPFFKALGWDTDNKAGYAEAYKDVIHEDAIRIGGAVKAPDYCFRIGGTRKFFLEAKKPAVFIKEEISPAYQIRRYGWNAKLSLNVLSDFEETISGSTIHETGGKIQPADGRRAMKDYHINIFYSEEDGGYIADIPDLAACSAFGETPNEALKEVQRARKAWLESARKEGKPIPKARYCPAVYQLAS